MGCGVGLRGQSYAIPTMQGGVETIEPYVSSFISFASQHPELAPLFSEAVALENVCLPESFVKFLK